ncbi:MAG TPA: type II toxin-antitoxin system mRNA interferase toxin, RelE/StbE family [Candidatus Saccharimonadales bacterium]|nr:type II toxin-antitoxin system mRNA interferase toxin, RelE/StbE family [Candidatus Saccharimonadales bacterium]
MNIKFSPDTAKDLKIIKRKDKKLASKIEKQLLLFQSNPKHPSLRIHKLSGSQKDTWSISITMSIRMVYKMPDDNTAYFIDIGTHDQVYKK